MIAISLLFFTTGCCILWIWELHLHGQILVCLSKICKDVFNKSNVNSSN